MSASKTNLQKQKRRHAGPLIGISLALAVGTVLFLGFLAYNADTEDEAAPPQAQTEEPSARPAVGAPATPMDDPDPAPSVVEPTPEPADPVTDPTPAPVE
ncbi:MAG: hypothetical protein JJU15_11580 [Pararhodobacter sp.]|nr:hypothetical protein [Pararhodobacter sp.]